MTAHILRPGSIIDPALVARGVRARVLRRLIEQSGLRAQRRLAVWIDYDHDDREGRQRAWDLYQEAENLQDRLYEARYGRTRW